MNLSHQSAQQIVREISEIVRQHVNMMDSDGVIIASTDPSRIGHAHEGARRIIEENLSELYISQDMETATTRNGLNLPLTIHDQVVGVVGITGQYEQVVRYGQIVKKMTEILMREGYEQDEKRLDQRVRNRFLEDWVMGDGLAHSQSLAERGMLLGIDITLPRRVMILSIQDNVRYINTSDGQKLIEDVEKMVSTQVEREGGIVLRNAGRQILLVTGRNDRGIDAFAQSLQQRVQKGFDVSLCIGVDGRADDLHKAYVEAQKAWKSAEYAVNGIALYDQLSLEIFVEDIPKQLKEEYLHKVFAGRSYEEIRYWVGILNVYFSAEGSVTKAAQQLFMHKNTFQYKLRKLEEVTGYDVRLPSKAPLLYMAAIFFRDVENDLLFLGN
ncbi:MAG: sugar diacid recognition domain-containing protein [Oscillospiraceae bacterium]|nr:sugar diacid recognition domain-containing protein [Oscillospiraceae bacterium]